MPFLETGAGVGEGASASRARRRRDLAYLLVDLIAVDVGDDTFERLHRETRDGLFLGDLQAPFDNHAFLPDVVEPEFDLRHDGVRARDLRLG